MIHQALGFAYLEVWRWWLLPPSLALSITIVALGLVGQVLEQLLDPRLAQGDKSSLNRSPQAGHFFGKSPMLPARGTTNSGPASGE